jgi:hypothetical protein
MLLVLVVEVKSVEQVARVNKKQLPRQLSWSRLPG